MLTLILKKIGHFSLIVLLLSLFSFSLVYVSLPEQSDFIGHYSQFIQGIFLVDTPHYALIDTPFHDLIQTVFLPTCLLFSSTIFFSFILGFPIGLAIGFQNSALTNSVIWCFFLFFSSLPIIVLSLIFMQLFARDEIATLITHFDLLPLKGASVDLARFDHLILNETPFSFALPLMILLLQPCAITIQTVAKQVQLVLQKRFIKLVRIQRRSYYDLIMNHIIPNIMPKTVNQLLNYTTTTLFFVLSVEIFFNLSGMGTVIYYAFLHQNVAIIALMILFSGSLVSAFWLVCQIVLIILYPFEQREFSS